MMCQQTGNPSRRSNVEGRVMHYDRRRPNTQHPPPPPSSAREKTLDAQTLEGCSCVRNLRRRQGAMKRSYRQEMACIWQPMIVNDTTK
jgi:hypothetical protein